MHTGCLFFADFSAWAHERTGTTSEPFVVTWSGRVWSASRLLRQQGLEKGIPVERALRLFPKAEVRQRDPHLETAVWDEVLHRLNALSPRIESPEPGIAFVGEPPLPRFSEVVQEMQAQAGHAGSRSHALLAAVRAGRGHVLRLAPAQVKAFLNRFPVDHLADLNFEPEPIRLLKLFGFSSLGLVATLSKRHLQAQFGEAGLRLYELLHPGKERPVATYVPPPTITLSHDFDQYLREPVELWPYLRDLVQQATHHLDGRTCQRISVSLQYQSRLHTQHRVLPRPTHKERTLLAFAERLVMRLLPAVPASDGLTLQLGALRHPAPHQLSFFHQRPALKAAIQAVHARFPGALLRARTAPHSLFPEDTFSLTPVSG